MERPSKLEIAQQRIEQDANRKLEKEKPHLDQSADCVVRVADNPPKKGFFTTKSRAMRRQIAYKHNYVDAVRALDARVSSFEYCAEQTRITEEARDLRLAVEEETGWGGGRYAVQTIEGVINNRNIRLHAKGMYHESWHGGEPRPWGYIGFIDEAEEIPQKKAEIIFKRYQRVLHERNRMEDQLNGATRARWMHTHHENIIDYFKSLKEPEPFRLEVRATHGVPTV